MSLITLLQAYYFSFFDLKPGQTTNVSLKITVNPEYGEKYILLELLKTLFKAKDFWWHYILYTRDKDSFCLWGHK